MTARAIPIDREPVTFAYRVPNVSGGRLASNVVSGPFRSEFCRSSDDAMRPKPVGPAPDVFQGGSARDMAARASEWSFTNVNTPEARAAVDDIVAQADGDAVRAFGHEAKNAAHASPEGEGNWANSTFADLVQYDDGSRSNLIGTPLQVAERIVTPKRAGADLIPLGFLHFRKEVEYFGQHVGPLVRELEAASPLAMAEE